MSMKLKKVSYVYSEGDAFEKKALDEISLEIPDGQFIGIIGHTGSGKSTLIQHLNGLLRATSGAIYYDGENIYQEGFLKAAFAAPQIAAKENATVTCPLRHAYPAK